MNIHNSYFSIINPFQLLIRWLHPYSYSKNIILNTNTIKINWTKRANTELINRKQVLNIELQLYFSCLVKKRVIFHESSSINSTPVNDNLSVSFRAVQSTACDPVEFAKNYPVKKTLTSNAAMKMHPSVLKFDYQNKTWIGEYFI